MGAMDGLDTRKKPKRPTAAEKKKAERERQRKAAKDARRG